MYLQTKRGRKALSTVAEEIVDNLSLMVQHFKDRTGEDPYLVMDNASIQACITGADIQSRQGNVTLDEAHRDELPPHSPDLNQTVEQSVGAVKCDVIGQVADLCQKSVASKGTITAEDLWRMGKKAMDNFKSGKTFAGGVRKSVYRMPYVWAAVAAEEDDEICITPHHKEHGTAGDWAPPSLR